MHPLAGRPAPRSLLVSVPRLVTAYYTETPDPKVAAERVAFGTSGHRGSSFTRSFNEAHIAAVTQAVCDHRKEVGIDGPLFLGIDTHALSEPALETALSVLAANGVLTMVDSARGYTPTPAISHAILGHNRGRKEHLADGIVITPSHNPPDDGGFKYNPPHGGPADTDVTKGIETRANAYLEAKLAGVKRVASLGGLERRDHPQARLHRKLRGRPRACHRHGQAALGQTPSRSGPAGRRSGGLLGADCRALQARFDHRERRRRPDLLASCRVDHDGKIRMDCSSPSAMAGLVELRDRFDLAFGNDADVDRHGIVTPKAGLLNPNHFLAIAIDYLAQHRPGFSPKAGIGKTLVSSSLIDRVAQGVGRPLVEVPGGFQVVRAGLVRRQSLLRRRRERRRVLPAPRWSRLDHRQRRHRDGPSGRRDPRRHRQGPRTTATPASPLAMGLPYTHAKTRPPVPRTRPR